MINELAELVMIGSCEHFCKQMTVMHETVNDLEIAIVD